MKNRAAGALSRAESGENAAPALRAIEHEADELIGTFEALLMISRVEAGGRAATLTEVDLAAVAREVHELFEPVVEDEGGRLTLEAPPTLAIQGNRELLAQALVNLIENATKHGRGTRPPVLTLRLVQKGGEARLSVSDNGPGVPATERERVQQRFARLDASRTTEGTGLGLALVRAVVRLHGGTLSLSDTEPGAEEPGLTVTAILPVGEPE